MEHTFHYNAIQSDFASWSLVQQQLVLDNYAALPSRLMGILEAGKIGLLSDLPQASTVLMRLSAWLALKGDVNVLDCACQFDLYQVAYSIRKFTPRLYAVAEQVHIVRSFTCFEVLNALKRMEVSRQPLIIFSLLSTFYDDAVSDAQSFRMLSACVAEIRRLNQLAPVLISLSSSTPSGSKRAGLLNLAKSAADEIIEPSLLTPLETQRMF